MDTLKEFFKLAVGLFGLVGAMLILALSFWPVWISLAAIVYIFSE